MSPAKVLASAVLLVQGGHVSEHVAQTLQVFKLGMPRSHSHGLLGSLFDLEWVHFVYNTAFLVALYAMFRGRRVRLREAARGPVWSLFVAGLTLQVYHELEHVVKMYQHLALGATPAPGLLGNLVDLVVLHLVFNLVAYLLVVPLLVQTVRARVNRTIGPAGKRPTPAFQAAIVRGSGTADNLD